jgi:DnaJ-domain-containing protein 1
MDGFLDRLADLLKSILGETPQAEERRDPKFTDPDLSEAWEELDDYLKGSEGRRSREERRGGGSRRPSPGSLDEDLRQDYANLEVPFGADIEEVKRAYKSLIMRYHPDKHAGNPEKLKLATEITKKVNESFERIRSRLEGGRTSRR